MRIRNTVLVRKLAMLITIAARIAQPRDSISRPSDVKPSIAKISAPISVLSQATRSRRAPLMTNAINTKVRM